MIRIVDYGVGNIQAFINVFKYLRISAARASSRSDFVDATHLILPGVGHFDHAMQKLNNSGLRQKLEELVIEDKIPIVGVCVGMQMLAEGSDEGNLLGLNWIPGRVRKFNSGSNLSELPMPHMGWNEVIPATGSLLFADGFSSLPQFYFLHSYYFDAQDKSDVAATAQYGVDFAAVVSRGHIHGMQFHPEKSHHWGAQILKNFVGIQ